VHAVDPVDMTQIKRSSRAALNTAVRWFSDCKLSLFHAYPFSSASFDAGHADADAWLKVASSQCDTMIVLAQ